MKFLFVCLLVIATFYLQAQTTTDSIGNFNLTQLNLSPEQKIAIKKLVWEYKIEDRRRRRELRRKMFSILNIQQQTRVRRWWRWQLKHSSKPH